MYKREPVECSALNETAFPGFRVIEEGSGRHIRARSSGKPSKTSFARCDRALVHMSSPQLCLFAQDLCKIKPVENPNVDGEQVMKSHPELRRY